MRIVVTGAGGFIGSWLVPELRAGGHTVIGVDMEEGDLRGPGVADAILHVEEPDVVVHLAAQVGRVFGEDDLHHTITSNSLMTARVALACRDVGARLVYASTSEVYGDLGSETAVEGGRMALPHNSYGVTKYHGETLAALHAPRGLQVLRLSMPYGPGLPAGRGRAALINFLWHASRGEPITVHRGAARSWCWVGDTVRGIRAVIEAGQQAASAGDWLEGYGVYNVGRDDNETTMLEVARMACDTVGADHGLIVEVDPPANQTVVKRLSTAKLRAMSWRPTVDLAEGIALTWEAVSRYAADGSPTGGLLAA